MDSILEKTLLYDFYGELLTDKQKKICELYYLNDLSLGEISNSYSISRQGVYDILKRSEKQLYYYEEKLGLVQQFLKEQKVLKQIQQIINQCSGDKNEGQEFFQDALHKISQLVKMIIHNE